MKFGESWWLCSKIQLSFYVLYFYFTLAHTTLLLKLWGLAFGRPLGETKQIPGKTNFCKSAESLDDPRKHHTGSSGISNDHTQKDEL